MLGVKNGYPVVPWTLELTSAALRSYIEILVKA